MTRIRFWFATAQITLVVMLMGRVVSADQPLGRPRTTTAKSPDGSKIVVSDPEMRVTKVFEVDRRTGTKRPLWSMIGWFRVAHIANDGKHLVIGYDGLDLLPRKHRKNEPMLYFIRTGQLVEYVTLTQLIENPAKMPKTDSHYAWGHYVGFTNKDLFVVETFEGLRVFDATTGKPIEK